VLFVKNVVYIFGDGRRKKVIAVLWVQAWQSYKIYDWKCAVLNVTLAKSKIDFDWTLLIRLLTMLQTVFSKITERTNFDEETLDMKCYSYVLDIALPIISVKQTYRFKDDQIIRLKQHSINFVSARNYSEWRTAYRSVSLSMSSCWQNIVIRSLYTCWNAASERSLHMFWVRLSRPYGISYETENANTKYSSVYGRNAKLQEPISMLDTVAGIA
jgi:hypothetical protein